MFINGTHIAYFHLCHRKLWLFANGLQMEHNSELVADGKLMHETTYTQRAEKYTEIELDGIKIDFYNADEKIIHETKRSDSYEDAHEWQLKYYIFVLKKNGIDGVTGILEYPKLRIRREIFLLDEDENYLKNIMLQIEQIVASDNCPPKAPIKKCKNCSYYDFCWSGEED